MVSPSPVGELASWWTNHDLNSWTNLHRTNNHVITVKGNDRIELVMTLYQPLAPWVSWHIWCDQLKERCDLNSHNELVEPARWLNIRNCWFVSTDWGLGLLWDIKGSTSKQNQLGWKAYVWAVRSQLCLIRTSPPSHQAFSTEPDGHTNYLFGQVIWMKPTILIQKFWDSTQSHDPGIGTGDLTSNWNDSPHFSLHLSSRLRWWCVHDEYCLISNTFIWLRARSWRVVAVASPVLA